MYKGKVFFSCWYMQGASIISEKSVFDELFAFFFFLWIIFFFFRFLKFYCFNLHGSRAN